MSTAGFCPGPSASGVHRLAGWYRLPIPEKYPPVVKREARLAPGRIDQTTPEAAYPRPSAGDVPASTRQSGTWSGLLAGLVLSASASASEFGGSNYIPGFYGDFQMAVFTPGLFLNNFLGYYGVEGNGISSDMVLEMPGLMGVHEFDSLDGRYLWAIYPAAMYANYGVAATATRDSTFTQRAGPGDMYLVPLGWTWDDDDWAVTAFQGIVAPTGSFSNSQTVNLGRDYWTFDSNVMGTWMFADKAFEISVDAGFMLNTQNDATDFHTGSEFHFDYLLGYHPAPAWALGVAGSYYTQIEGDSGRGAPPLLIDGEAATLGPAVMYTFKAGEREVSVALKWLHEISVNNHLPGDYILMRTMFQF